MDSNIHSRRKHENIFVFWPNLIGYARVFLAAWSFYFMSTQPRMAGILYSCSCLLDALDGYTASVFDQSTRFGAVLDMVTDRCTTACLLVYLSIIYPQWIIYFQGLVALDLASHYMHMYASLVVGGTNSSHKNMKKSDGWLLHLYYTNKVILFLLAAFNEIFFISLYLIHYSSTPADSGHEVAGMRNIDSEWQFVLAIISFPFMAVKQIINIVQLIHASQLLAEVDLNERQKKNR